MEPRSSALHMDSLPPEPQGKPYIHTREYYSAIKGVKCWYQLERCPDEPWELYAKGKKSHERPHTGWFHLYRMSRRGKPMETIPQGCGCLELGAGGSEDGEWPLLGTGFLFRGRKNIINLDYGDDHGSTSKLKSSYCVCKQWLLWNVNCISIKWFLKVKKMYFILEYSWFTMRVSCRCPAHWCSYTCISTLVATCPPGLLDAWLSIQTAPSGAASVPSSPVPGRGIPICKPIPWCHHGEINMYYFYN